ncbi:penicillin acylase family protein [Pseudoalteromonas umbrosa]|uniref:penicillin acylase family protein n=1 Tax=Pseudoalteromonas umbrosa TaxID=3048489 RepID=UPI0024C32D00|nr:penicillin acylase family protein [Pseudoalteromonas sp. B95]MDK1289725.1 penicillin acylase family protein [Pseudoalteromonas sp. B95]
MIKKYPLLARFLIFLIMPLIVFTLLTRLYLIERPLNMLGEKVEVSGISHPISIERDQYGVVSLIAQSDKDAFFAMGYVHAQDRLWQLELQRRLVKGTLSEIMGKNTVKTDLWIRTLQLYNKAQKSIPHLSPQAVASLEAYTDGINTWISQTEQLPAEFSLLNNEMSPWTVADSLAWIKLFALNLSGDLNEELIQLVVSNYLNPDQLRSLFPNIKVSQNRHSSKSDVESYLAMYDINKELESKFNIGGKYVGSNVWAVDGKRSETGYPIIANDPHLGLQIPSFWYAVKIQGENLNVQGQSIVGLPIVMFGKNKEIAWGGANMMADTQDLVPLVINPDNAKQYWYEGKWHDFTVVSESISIKNDFPAMLRPELNDIELSIRMTKVGPVINDNYSTIDGPVALRWTGLSEQDTTYQAMLEVNYASSLQSFRSALAHFVAPTLNLLYVDEHNIALQGVGKIPIRQEVDKSARYSDPDVGGWIGYIPYSEMPQQTNPPSGIIINANNRNVADDYPHYISSYFAPPYRAQRVKDLIDKYQQIGVAHMREIQADVFDLSAVPMKSYVHYIKATDKEIILAKEALEQWDGRVNKDSIGATIAHKWLENIKRDIFKDELSPSWNNRKHNLYLQSFVSSVEAATVYKTINDESPWCDNVKTEALESCADVLHTSFTNSIGELQQQFGRKVEDWRWGDTHFTVLKHMPFSDVKVLKQLFERQLEAQGHINTINASSYSYDKDNGYSKVFGAGFRQIISMSPSEPSHEFINSTGQSGQIGSKHYDDMVGMFSNFEYINFDKNRPVSKSQTLIPVN